MVLVADAQWQCAEHAILLLPSVFFNTVRCLLLTAGPFVGLYMELKTLLLATAAFEKTLHQSSIAC